MNVSSSSSPGDNASGSYRADIDGLRAIAVVSVLLFHFDFTKFGGGFVGVDIFFVISGFLITRLIVSDLRADRFSFARFYTRRARRLLPALFATLALSLVAGALLLTPEHLKLFGRSMVASMLSVSNILFWHESGYFDPGGYIKPLLHTWSLSVEEQFYLLWPLTAAWLWRVGRERLLIIALAVACVLSIAAADYWLQVDPSAAFYWTPFRVAELGIGALCVWLIHKPVGNALAADALVGLGLFAIAYAVISFDSQTPFPGRMALVPCLGTAAIIYAGGVGRVGVLLGNRAMVSVGKISYSLYLVHWPLYVYYRYWSMAVLSRSDKVGLLALSFALAWLMYTFVERPFRTGTSSARALTFAMASMALLIVVPAGSAWLSAGWTWRLSEEEATTGGNIESFSAARDQMIRVPQCHMSEGFDAIAPTLPGCLLLKADAPNFLVIGDSHAADLWSALKQAYPSANFLQATGAGCTPITRIYKNPRNDCGRLLSFIKRDFPNLEALDGVILSARWGGRVDDLRAEINFYRTRKLPVVVFGRVPEYELPVRRILHHFGTRQALLDSAERFRSPAVSDIDRSMQAALRRDGTPYVSSITLFCRNDQCPLLDERGSLMIQDYGHWGVEASRFFARAVRQRFPKPLSLFALP